MKRRTAQPTGYCWCGCGQRVGKDAYWIPGHDADAVEEIIKRHFGRRADFVLMCGYEPEWPADARVQRTASR